MSKSKFKIKKISEPIPTDVAITDGAEPTVSETMASLIKKHFPETTDVKHVKYISDTGAETILNILANQANHGLVLQYCHAGWYVQIQIAVEPKIKSQTKVLDLQWQPITDLHSNPKEALAAALKIPFGKLLSAPPSPATLPGIPEPSQTATDKPTEGKETAQAEENKATGTDKIPGEATDLSVPPPAQPSGVDPSQPEKRRIRPITFLAYKCRIDDAKRTLSVVGADLMDVTNRIGNKLCCTMLNENGRGGTLGVVFDLTTGSSIKGKDKYSIPPSTLEMVQTLTLEIDDDAILIDREAPADYIMLEATLNETIQERYDMLKALEGRRCKAKRKYHNNGKFSEVIGTFLGELPEEGTRKAGYYIMTDDKPVAIQVGTLEDAGV